MGILQENFFCVQVCILELVCEAQEAYFLAQEGHSREHGISPGLYHPSGKCHFNYLYINLFLHPRASPMPLHIVTICVYLPYMYSMYVSSAKCLMLYHSPPSISRPVIDI